MSEPLLTVIGLAVLDDIHFSDGTVVKDVLGGSGAFCTIGARIFSPDGTSKSISWLVRTGADFPGPVADEIASWDVNSILLKLPDAPSPRGRVIYRDPTFGSRTFQYTTTVNNVLPEHLADHPSLLTAQYFHVMCPATHISSRVEALLDYRRCLALSDRPCIVWEASTSTYLPEHLQTCFEAVQSVDVFSPNHVELLALFGLAETEVRRDLVEELASQFLQAGVGPEGDGVMVIRAAEHGCLIMSRSIPPVWLPAFYPPQAGNVVDTTGAGNAFLGGFIVGHSVTGDFVKAAHYGTVVASFLVEQIGVPKLDRSDPPAGRELWNGEDPFHRLEAYQQRLNMVDL